MRSEIVGIPNDLVSAVPSFGRSTRKTGGGK